MFGHCNDVRCAASVLKNDAPNDFPGPQPVRGGLKPKA
jgi:hypothetical protein